MKLNSVDWSKAQDLLVELVQVLTPLTERIVPASFFLSRRFLIPSAFTQDESHPSPLRHPVRLLTDLHSVQKKVEKWIGEAQKEAVEKETAGRPATKIENKREASPLSKQAQKLIQQVQHAIEEIATSTYIKNPVEAPLREALRKLKPNLDRIIDSVEQNRGPEKNPPGFFRHPVPRSSREELISKLVTSSKELESPSSQPKEPALPNQALRPTIKTDRSEERTLDRQEPEERAPSLRKTASEKRRGEGGVIEKRGAKENPLEGNRAPLPVEKGQSEARPAPKPLEVIALPGAPFISHAKNLLHPGKKKKRKGFWYRGEEERENPPQ